MSVIELLILAVGLSMDAFAVAVCKGLTLKKIKLKHTLIAGAYFGLFQGVMPLIGFALGVTFADKIEKFDHWIAFVLLSIIGMKMVLESFSKEKPIDETASADLSQEGTGENAKLIRTNEFSFKKMLPLAFATSVDALAVGISLSLLSVNIWLAGGSIGAITFLLSGAGVAIGFKFGSKYKSKAELAGGVILVLIGLKILLEHLGVISF